MRSIKLGLFISKFFNSGMLIWLSTTNFSEQGIPILSTYLTSGEYTDFNSDWFLEVGPLIVETMQAAAFMPIIEFMIAYAKTKVFYYKDQFNYIFCFKNKKITSIQDYIDKIGGEEMHLHSFHSTLLNTFFVCLMFGTALPILYPIGLLTFVILYVSHRLQVFYFFKQPPMYDKELTSNTLKLVPFACIIHMFFTYWFLDNK